MAPEIEQKLRDLKVLKGKLGVSICKLGSGGDGSVYLHEMESDGVISKVAVKSVKRKDSLWIK